MAAGNRKLATPPEHWGKAVKIHALADGWLATGEFGAAVTGFFYASVHYVTAYLSTKGIRYIASHTMRDSYMANDGVLSTVVVYNSYGDLQEASEDVRYSVRNATVTDAKNAAGRARSIRQVLEPIVCPP